MKHLRVAIVLGVVLVVSLIAGAYAAGQERAPLTAAEAQEFTVRAFTASGVDSVEVTGEPRAETFTPTGRGEVEDQASGGETREPIEVWVVPANVSGQPVELYVARRGDHAVNLDDALPGGGYVLTDEQFDRLAQFRLDLAGEEMRDQRQGPALVAGVLIALATALLIFSAVRGRRNEPTGE